MESTPTSPRPPTRRPGILQVLLGLFICWQLIFIVGSSIIALPEESPLPPVSRVLENWSWLTGQEQGWRQFTPAAPTQAAFVAVELEWADRPPVRIVSESEPADLGQFIRPFGGTRLGGYEGQFTMIGLKEGAAAVQENPERWRDWIAETVSDKARPLRAYLAWRVREFTRAHADQPPVAGAVLFLRIYQIPEAARDSWRLKGPVELPLARWKPGQADVEAFDPVTESFMKIAEGKP